MAGIIRNNIISSTNKAELEEPAKAQNSFAEQSLGSTEKWRLRAKVDFAKRERYIINKQLETMEASVTKTMLLQLKTRDSWYALKSSSPTSAKSERKLYSLLKENSHFHTELQRLRYELNDVELKIMEMENSTIDRSDDEVKNLSKSEKI